MKKIVFTVLLSLPCCWLVAQCPTNPSFSTQGQVDNFPVNYPNCDSIQGSLSIGPSADIADLSALAGIRFIDRSIIITGNEVLTTLSGLDSLYSFGRNPTTPFYTPDSLVIRDNDLLPNLKGFGNPLTELVTPRMKIVVADNDALKNLEGFEFLQRVGGYFSAFGSAQRTGGLKIQQNINLIDLKGLEGLSGGIVEIQDNDQLQSLEGFGHGFGDSSAAYLDILGNDALPTLQGLDSLSQITALNIDQNSNLQSLSGLENLAQVNGG